MIADLKPYPSMKDSGVSWFGEMPEHWAVRRLRNAVTIRVSNVDKHVREGETEVRLCNYVDVYNHDCISQRNDFMRVTAKPEEIAQFRLEEGDVLITKDSEAWDDIGVPAVVTEPAEDLISGYHLALLRPFADVLIGGYLLRVLQSKGLAHQFHVEAKGVTRYGLSHAAIKSVRLVVPPLPEQAAIVRFLDHADRRIRRYIRAKQKLITLLEEQKQAIIQQAVTGQLDVRTGQPYPAYKDSGVEWLGQVPEHWEVMAFKHIGLFRSGAGFPIGEQGHQNLTLPFFKVSDMNLPSNDKVMTIGNNSVSHDTAARLRAPVFPSGTIVFPKVGGALLTNKRRVVGRPCCIDNNLMGCIVRRGNSHFVLLLLEQLDLATIAKPGPVPAISEGEVREIRTVFPPFQEQPVIAGYLDKATGDTDSAINRSRRQIELLREYRTRLIADVVTGKLDVREAAAGLPEVDPLADEFDALTTQAGASGMMELEDAAETLEGLAMENEATV